MPINRRWCVAVPEHDRGGLSLEPGHFVMDTQPTPELAEGEILIRAHYFALDPMNHVWVRGMVGRFDPIPPGEVMRGAIAGIVTHSRDPEWPVGSGVSGFLDWAEFSVCRGGVDRLGIPLYRVPEGIALESGVASLGITGICALLGLTDHGRMKPGDTVVISGASGGIGLIAGQIAHLMGGRTIGLVRGSQRFEQLHALGFDEVIDTTADDLENRIAMAAPDGINVFLDNVGGHALDAALANMAKGGHITICGVSAQYGGESAPLTRHRELITRNLVMSGLSFFDSIDRWPWAREQLASWLRNGALREMVVVTDGFEAAPAAALAQFGSGGIGRKLVRTV